MATWMTHLRIADCYLDGISQYGVNIQKFIFANIAPDCGVLQKDQQTYMPSKEISHFGKTGEYDFERYAADYLVNKSDMDKFSFYLGYYLHLLCDEAWAYEIYRPEKRKYIREFENEADVNEAIKRNWSDLDKLFLEKNPSFRAFQIFVGIHHFENNYFDFFPADAFDKQLYRLRSAYLEATDELIRENGYLTEQELDGFVNRTANKLREKIFAVI